MGRALRIEPVLGPPVKASAPVLAPAVTAPKAPAARDPVLFADSADSSDLLGAAEAVQPIAELALAPEAQTPFFVGIVGPSGSGKSFALRRLVGAIEGLAKAAAKTTGGPFLSRVVFARVDAAGVSGDPASALASAAFVALEREREGGSYAAFADEAAHATTDPRRAATAAAERHDDITGRLEAERAARDEVEARRARLSEALLYETPGSRVDTFVRTSRATIDSRLRRFGLGEGDTGANYRDLVRDLSSLGAGSRLAIGLRAIWAYSGQVRLLLVALVAFLLAFGVDRLRSPSAADGIKGLSDSLTPASDWLTAHGEWLERAIEILIVVGLAALFLNVWRAVGFSALLYRGLRLLNFDIRERRRELDASAARLERRIATLSAEAEASSAHAQAMAKRVKGGAGVARAPGPVFLQALETPAKTSREFFAELGRLMSAAGPAATTVPQRLIFAFDNLELLSPADASRLLETAGALFGPGCIGLVACDAAALSSTPGRWTQKLFQVVVDARTFGATDGARFSARLISTGAPLGSLSPADASRSALGEPLSQSETALLTALAPLTEGTPRAVKRFHNAYRLARLAKAPRPLVALALAALQSPDAAVARGLRDAITAADGDVADPPSPTALTAATQATRASLNGPIAKADALAAWDAARRYAPAEF